MDATYYTTEEIAERLKVAVSSVQRWCRTGRLKGVRVGKGYRVPETELRAFLSAPDGTTETIATVRTTMDPTGKRKSRKT